MLCKGFIVHAVSIYIVLSYLCSTQLEKHVNKALCAKLIYQLFFVWHITNSPYTFKKSTGDSFRDVKHWYMETATYVIPSPSHLCICIAKQTKYVPIVL